MAKPNLDDLTTWVKRGMIQERKSGGYGIPVPAEDAVRYAKKTLVDKIVNGAPVAIPNAIMTTIESQTTTQMGTLVKAGLGEAAGLLNGVVKDMGVPPGLAEPMLGALQAAASGDIGGVIKSVAPALVGMMGPYGAVAGPLLALGLGVLFGPAKKPPPPPPRLDRSKEIKPRLVRDIPLDFIMRDIVLASFRWHVGKQVWGTASKYPTDFGLSPKDFKDPGKMSTIVMPFGHSRLWRVSESGYVREDDTKHKQPANAVNTGAPAPWKGERPDHPDPAMEGILGYWFPHDAMAAFVGYNTGLSAALAARIKGRLSKFDKEDPKKYPQLAPFMPGLGVQGWAEFITANYLLAAWERDLPMVWWYGDTSYKTIQANAAKLLAPYQKRYKEESKAGRGIAYLQELGADPTSSGVAMFAYIASETLTAVAAGPQFFKKGQDSQDVAAAQGSGLQKWMDGQFKEIKGLLGQIITTQAEQGKDTKETKALLTTFIKNQATNQAEMDQSKVGRAGLAANTKAGGFSMAGGGWPMLVGAGALAGGMWWLNRRSTKQLQGGR